jgi:transposase
VWTGEQTLTPVHRAPVTASDPPQHIANGFSESVLLTSAEGAQWAEQRLVVPSLKQAAAQQKRLDQHLQQAEQDLAALNQRGRGRPRRDAAQTRAAVDDLLTRHAVAGLLTIEIPIETQTTRTRAYLARPARDVTTVNVTVRAARDTGAYQERVRGLGWRVFVCNDPALGVSEAVLADREEYLIERGFNRYRGKLLGLTPLYLSSTTRIKGLIRLLSIGLRVLCLVEFSVREALQAKAEKLDQLYAGNPKRATARPTTELMLRAFAGLTLVVVSLGGTDWLNMTPLNAVQSRIVSLLDFPQDLYLGVGAQSG